MKFAKKWTDINYTGSDCISSWSLLIFLLYKQQTNGVNNIESITRGPSCQYGILIPSEISIKLKWMIQRRAARWVKNNYSPYDSVSNMLDGLGWRSLENRRIDSRLVMFYRIIHGYVAIQIPTYFEKPQRYTRQTHPLCFRQIHTFAAYYQQSFYPATIVLWNRLPSDIVLRVDLDSFKEGVCKINHQSP